MDDFYYYMEVVDVTMPRKRSSSADNVMHASLGGFNVRQGGFGGGGQRDVEGRHG